MVWLRNLALLLLVIPSCLSAKYPAAKQHISQHAIKHGTTGDLPNIYTPTVNVNTGQLTKLNPTLYGVFFEEINHAGDGGLYAEFVFDRSFDELALNQRIESGDIMVEPVDWSKSNSSRLRTWAAAGIPAPPAVRNDVRKMWRTLGNSTTFSLNRSNPLNPGNPVAAQVQVPSGFGGLTNTGYWGMAVRPDIEYKVTFWAHCQQGNVSNLTVSLHSFDGQTVYASAVVPGLGSKWQKFAVILQPNTSDSHAALTLAFFGPGTVILDVVSMFKAETDVPGQMNPYPFRLDLLQALRDLKPRFIRFPGGCYVEGNMLVNRFNWRTAVGPIENRPGHWNTIWGYWSTDGLGLYEYMLLCEELGAAAIYVFNVGIAHGDNISPDRIWPWIQDVMDAIEFLTGPPSSTWGKVRASMGHTEPFVLPYAAIGNEDCDLPHYHANYLMFYSALKIRYPTLRLISNCWPDANNGPTEVYDDHRYLNQVDMWRSQGAFNGYNRQSSARVFMSEYAAVGVSDSALISAIAEAGFMTGLDRNGDVVELASYAPLFARYEDQRWVPDLIFYNSSSVVLTPSYHVQRMFSQHMGTHYAATQVSSVYRDPLLSDPTLAASATCQDPACSKLSVKVVNIASIPAQVTLTLAVGASAVAPNATLCMLSSDSPFDRNTLAEPTKVAPKISAISNATSSMVLLLPPYSMGVLTLDLHPPSN